MTRVPKAITRSQIGPDQYVRPMSVEANLQAKQKQSGDMLILSHEDLMEDSASVLRKGRASTGPGSMQRVNIKALRQSEVAQTSGHDIPVTTEDVIKVPGFNDEIYPSKSHSSKPGATVATGDMTACVAIGLIGDAKHPDPTVKPSMASVTHIYPTNLEYAIRASIREDVELMRDDHHKLEVSAGIAGGDPNYDLSVRVERIARDELAKLGVPIREEHDKAGKKRDGFDKSFVQAAQVGKDNVPRLGNTLRIVDSDKPA